MHKFRTDDGVTLAYRLEGTGLPLLALAGLTRDGRDFDYLAPNLPADTMLIRLDSRGRGGSDWAPHATYSVGQEVLDALALLDHLGIGRAAILGSSRGGLLGLVIAATARHRLLGLCLNDVGPVLEREGLLRIGSQIGVEPSVPTLADLAEQLPLAMPGFQAVPKLRWHEEAARHYVQHAGRVGLTYDPALRQSFEAAMAAPLPELWPLFDACAGLPLALIRGAASDVLSRATAEEMRRRRPDLAFAEIADRGHIPFLDEPAAVDLVHRWLELVRAERDAAG
ncbi:MAG: alpha/beta hydrolase [Rhodobacterales bacterium 32-66-7]|nr:MAG: alpha/beta hydrolase [Rhodobacterales bacterium 32-66-7]